MTGAFVCFLDSYFLFSLFGLSNSLRIRGYLIKYPRIFHHVSVDISSRIRGYFITYPRLREVFALLLRLIACMGLAFLIMLFLFLLTQISRISRNLLPSLFFVSRETEFAARRGQRQSREKREDFFHRWIFGLTQISRISRKHTSLALVCTIRLRALGKADKRGRSDAPSVRFVRSV